MATLISTPQDLHNIRNDLSGSYELANDIDLGSWGNWTPIDGFMGSLDGKGYVIRNLTINDSRNYVGLFGNFGTGDNGYIGNLGLENVDIVTTGLQAGALYGYLNNSTFVIENCYVKGGRVQASRFAGGMFGQLRNGVTVRNCFVELDEVRSTTSEVGGFVGVIQYIETNYVNVIENCYAVTKTLESPSSVHGFGYNITEKGINKATNCYYDSEVTGVTTSDLGEGKTTSEMKSQSTYPTYDFTTVWGMNGGYPYLQAFGIPIVPPKQETREVSSYLNSIQSNVNVQTYTYQPPQTVTRQVNTHVNTLSSHVEQFIATKRNVEGYLSPIHSNVITDLKSGKIEVRNISSFINPIYSKLGIEIYRKPLTVSRYIVSHLKPLQAHIDVLIHVPTIPIHATVNVLENGSVNSYMQNNTNIYRIKNPSYCEVVK